MTSDDGEALLASAEDRLVALVPPLVRSLGFREPVYCLRLWYYEGGGDGGRLPSVLLAPDAARRRALAEHGNTAPHYLWCADELTGSSTGAFSAETVDVELSGLMQRWHARPSSGDDAEDLAPVRAMVQRAAARLGEIAWASHAPVTDDFVVFAADGTHTFCNDYAEMVASVPADRIALLRSRRMLGDKTWYDLGGESADAAS